MIIAHIGDIHLNEKDKHTPLPQQHRQLEWFGLDAWQHEAKAMLVAGDVFHGASTPAERNVMVDIVKYWADWLPVIIVKGNHDRPGDLQFLGEVRTRQPVHVVEQPAVIRLRDLVVACIPWPNKANIVAASRRMGLNAQFAVSQTAAELMQALLRSFTVQIREDDRPSVLLAHAEIGTAVMDSGQPVSPHADISLSVGDLLDTGADYFALGHIHKHQILQDMVCYCGSTRQTNWGEGWPKGYCLVDVKHSRAPEIVLRPNKSCRHLVTVDLGDWDPPDKVLLDQLDDYIDCSVKLKYDVAHSDRNKMRQMAEHVRTCMLEAGAHLVQIDGKVRPEHRVRSEQIQKARTVKEQLEALWECVGEPDRPRELLAKLEQLERELQGGGAE